MSFFKRFLKQLRSNVITGTLLMIPLLVTILIIVQLFLWLDSVLPRILGVNMPPGLGILITLVIAYITGITAKNYVGKKIIAVGNGIIGSIPFLNKIYLTIQQVVDMVSINKNKVFERAVLIEFPHVGSYAIGFVTSQKNNVFSLKVGQKLVAVFIPTTPNPTSGFLIYIPEEDVVDANISVEAAIKLIMSGGLLGADNASIAKKLDLSKKNWKWTDLFNRKANKDNITDPRD